MDASPRGSLYTQGHGHDSSNELGELAQVPLVKSAPRLSLGDKPFSFRKRVVHGTQAQAGRGQGGSQMKRYHLQSAPRSISPGSVSPQDASPTYCKKGLCIITEGS